MSTRESGSNTWPRFTALPGDNLELGNAPEEDDVDHGPEPQTWRSGTAAVGTGAGPPDLDQETEADHDGHPYPADVVAVGDTTAAPGFGDVPADGFEAAGPEPGFGDEPEFGEDADDAAGAPGFGDAAAAGPRFGAAPETEAFASPAAAGYGGQVQPGQGFEHQGADGPGFGGPGYSNGQQGEYAGDYQGEYAGGYQHGGYGGAPPGGGFGAPGTAPAYGGPGVATGYPGQENGTATGYPGQDNGAAGREQVPFPGQYPADEPSRSRFGSLRMRRKSKRSRPGRQAQLTVARVEPWSVMKFSFVNSLVAFIVLFVAVAVLYGVLSGLGVFSALQRTIESITSSQSSSGFNLQTYLSASRVLGYTGLLGAINVVLITAISTVGSVLYNITADLAGGVEVTLKETD
jgi:Transmembrane domain of unknown function (DUF3566)